MADTVNLPKITITFEIERQLTASHSKCMLHRMIVVLHEGKTHRALTPIAEFKGEPGFFAAQSAQMALNAGDVDFVVLTDNEQAFIRKFAPKPPQDDVEKTIFINGEPTKILVPSLTYEDICRLAGKNPAHNPSLTIMRADTKVAGFILTHGKSYEVMLGDSINCMVTGNA